MGFGKAQNSGLLFHTCITFMHACQVCPKVNKTLKINKILSFKKIKKFSTGCVKEQQPFKKIIFFHGLS